MKSAAFARRSDLHSSHFAGTANRVEHRLELGFERFELGEPVSDRPRRSVTEREGAAQPMLTPVEKLAAKLDPLGRIRAA